jgi:DNA-directed RNA polymerase specialized sigma24 family protein
MDRSPDQDRDDVAGVLAGDIEAFSGIVHRWQGPLVALAFRFCRHPARAEELAQEAFLRAYRRLGQWRGEAAFSTWLFAVATNVYRSEVRRVRPQEVALQESRRRSSAGRSGRCHGAIETRWSCTTSPAWTSRARRGH